MTVASGTEVRRWRDDPWRLPDLTGRMGNVVRSVIAILAAATIVIVSGSLWFTGRDIFGNMGTAAEYGFRTGTGDDSKPQIAAVSREGADGVTLRKHDRILSINGRTLPQNANEFTIAEWLAADGDGRVTLVTRSPDGSRRTHVLERRPGTSATREASTDLPLWAFMGLLFFGVEVPSVLFAITALILAWRRPRDAEALLLTTALLVVSAGFAMFWLTQFNLVPGGAPRATGLSGFYLLMLAILAFPDGRLRGWAARIGAIACLFMICTVLWNANVFRLSELIPAVLFPGILLCGLAAIRHRFRRVESPIERQQLKWALLGFAAAIACLLPTAWFVATDTTLSDRAEFLLENALLPFFFIFLTGGVLISILRYRLYDADAVIGRSAAYAALTVGFVALFAGSQQLIEVLGQQYFGEGVGGVAGGIGAALAAVAIAPMHNRVQRWAGRRFQRALFTLRQGLPALVGDLRETAGMEQIAGATLDSVMAGVQSRRAALVVGGEVFAARDIPAGEVATWLEKWDEPAHDGIDVRKDDALFPARIPLEAEGHGRVGWLLLGPRPDGSLFGKAERDTLDEIADPVARAVQVALRRAERDRAIEHRLANVEKAIARLARRIGPQQSPDRSLA